jgi:hypothetical protein
MESISHAKEKDQHNILVNGNRVSVSFYNDQTIDHKQKRLLDKHERYLQRVKNHILNEFNSFNFTRKHHDQDYYNSLDNNNNNKKKKKNSNSQSDLKFSLDYGLEEEEENKNVQLETKYVTTENSSIFSSSTSTAKSSNFFTGVASTPLAPFKEITNYVISKAIGSRNKTSVKHKTKESSLNENYLDEYLLLNKKQENCNSKKSKSNKSKKMSSSNVYTKNSTGSMVVKLQNSLLKRQQAKVNLTLKSNETKMCSSQVCESCTYCDQCQMGASTIFVPNSWLENSNILSSTRVAAPDEDIVKPFNIKNDFITTRNKVKPQKVVGTLKHAKMGKVKAKRSYILPRTSSLNGNAQMHAAAYALKVTASKSKSRRRSEKFLKKLNMIDSFQQPQQNSIASSSNENFNNFGDLLVWYV